MDTRLTRVCPGCGEPLWCDIVEAWGNHEFMIDSCCEWSHQEFCELAADDPRGAAQMLNSNDENKLFGRSGLRRVIESDGRLLLDWAPDIVRVSWRTARQFVADHHRHNPRVTGWKFGAGLVNGSTLVAVVIVGRPVACALAKKGFLEVTRLCVRPDLPRGLAWNACSTLYGWAARKARGAGAPRIVTYTRDDEAGDSLRAAGWTAEARVRAASWDRASRPRPQSAPPIAKTRWARDLRPPTARHRAAIGIANLLAHQLELSYT
jgi:hypothetical protein